MKSVLILVIFGMALEAQSISVTAPTAGQLVSGYSGFSFSVSLGNAASVARVCYQLDGYPAMNPGFGELPVVGCSITPPYSFSWNSYWVLNGSHQVIATAYNSLGGQVATSAPISFTVANPWPISCTPNMTVSPDTPVSSPWSGQVGITLTQTGACAGDSGGASTYVDGIPQLGGSFSAGTATVSVDTTEFTDAPHIVCVKTSDNPNQSTVNGTNINSSTDWCASITFANGASAMEVRNNAHEVFLAPGDTFQLSNSAVNNNGSAGSSPTYAYQSLKPSVATVSPSGLITAVANGSAQIQTLWQACSGTDLHLNTGGLGATSATCPMLFTDLGNLINITAGSNCTPGIYQITGYLSANGAGLDRSAGNAGANCTFATGPTRTGWVFVWPENILPHFSGSGAVLTSYTPGSSFFAHCLFSSGGIFADQPYNLDPAQDLSNGGINCVETGAAFQDLTGSESPSGSAAWYAAQSASVAANQAKISAYPKLKWSLTGDNFARGSSQLWGATQGPASQWNPPAYQYTIQSWAGFGNVLWIAMADEVNSSWSSHPLQGPVTFTASPAQSWLSGGSIDASSGVCTVNATSSYTLNGANAFIITGATTPGLTFPGGTTHGANRIDSNHFTFNCAAVADGHYDAVSDPGLTIEPYVAQWFAGNTSYITSDAFENLQTQFNAAAPGFSESWPNAGGTTCQSIANWGGNGTQSRGSISQIADHTDMYWAPNNLPYIISREASNSLVSANMGTWVRQNYGCFNPSLPITVLTQGTVIGSGNAGYGQQGYAVPISSISGSTITFAAPHGIANIIPGTTRLSISGSSNPAYNTNFYVVAAPTATTLTVVFAIADFTGSGSGGAITFEDGSTKDLNNISSSSNNNCSGQGGLGCLDGNSASYAGGVDTSFPRHRGQTFTLCGVTGAAASNYNNCGGTPGTGNVFLYTIQNLSAPALAPGFHYRELPSGVSTGGTASINADNNYVRGRNYAVAYADLQPGWAFGSLMECVILRCAGQRIYKWGGSQNGYVDNPGGGFVGNSLVFNSIFNDTTLGNQTFANQHYENGNAVPVFHALSILSLVISRWQEYILQPALNSPDYGSLLDCAARAGSYGKIMFCFNASDGPQTRTFNLSAYAASGQPIIRNVVTPFGAVTLTILSAGTSTDTLSLNPDDAVFYVFPLAFATEMQQPRIAVRLADVANAVKVAVRYGYDPYSFDAPVNTVFDCGAGSCTLPVDRTFGTVYYRVIYLDVNSNVLATSDVETL